jgi:AcrR family transcriptional regulator
VAKLYQSEAWLRRVYLVEKLSTSDIAKRCGATEMTIYRYLNKFGIMGKR